MLRTERKVEAKTKRILATGGAIGISATAILIGLSLVFLSLRQTRVQVELERKD